MFTAEMPTTKKTELTPTLEEDLQHLPDEVADAMGKWLLKQAERRREYARLFLTFKAKNVDREITNTELKCMVTNDQGFYQICLDEIMEESRYRRKLERLMASKKLASLRTAF